MTYRVYFDQVNQSRYDIEAQTREQAILKAKKLWLQENGIPHGAYVEEDHQQK